VFSLLPITNGEKVSVLFALQANRTIIFFLAFLPLLQGSRFKLSVLSRESLKNNTFAPALYKYS